MPIEERLWRLERRTRQLLFAFGVVVAVGLVATLATGRVAAAQTRSQSAEELRTKRLLIVDDQGRTRIELAAIEGQPGLFLYDAAGECNATLMLSKGRPWLFLLDTTGKRRAVLAVSRSGPGLHLRDAAGTTRATVGLSDSGPELGLYDAVGS